MSHKSLCSSKLTHHVTVAFSLHQGAMALAARVPSPGQLLPISNRQHFVDALQPAALQCAAAHNVVCLALQKCAADTAEEADRLTDRRMLPAARKVVQREGLAAIRSIRPNFEGCV
jgi:hypothetical protein